MNTLIKQCPIVTHTRQQPRQVNTIRFVHTVPVAASHKWGLICLGTQQTCDHWGFQLLVWGPLNQQIEDAIQITMNKSFVTFKWKMKEYNLFHIHMEKMISWHSNDWVHNAKWFIGIELDEHINVLMLLILELKFIAEWRNDDLLSIISIRTSAKIKSKYKFFIQDNNAFGNVCRMAAFCVGLSVLRNYEISSALTKKISFPTATPANDYHSFCLSCARGSNPAIRLICLGTQQTHVTIEAFNCLYGVHWFSKLKVWPSSPGIYHLLISNRKCKNIYLSKCGVKQCDPFDWAQKCYHHGVNLATLTHTLVQIMACHMLGDKP